MKKISKSNGLEYQIYHHFPKGKYRNKPKSNFEYFGEKQL
jgi:hypothetical protein